MGMEINGGIFVWGSHNDGLLGLGYNVTHVENPTLLINSIKELSISDSHAVAIDFNGDIFSWGSGKYGELCLDKLIYCPKPTKKVYENQENKNTSINNITNLNISSNQILNGNNNKNLNNPLSQTAEVKKYRKVFCSDLLTCFIDENGKFSYYGVIIKIFKDDNSSITIKSLLRDENNSDPNYLFKEKIIYELENEKFNQISIGNGFLGLLSEKGLVYTLDHSDNITLLYTKFFVYSICVSNNQLFGLCKNINNKQVNFPNSSVMENFNNLVFDEEETNENKPMNGYLCRWIAQFSEKDIISDSWTTQLFKIKEEIDVENMAFLDSHNKEILFVIQFVNGFSKKLALNLNASNDINNSFDSSNNKENKNNRYDYNQNNNNLTDNIHSKSILKESFGINLNENKIENFNMSGLNLRKNSMENSDFNALTQIGFFDDSYNLKYKRVKNNFHGVRTVSSDNTRNRNSIIKTHVNNQIKNEVNNNNEILNNNKNIKKKKLDIPKSSNNNITMNNKNSLNSSVIPKSPELNKLNSENRSLNYNNSINSKNINIDLKSKNNEVSNFELKAKISSENMITDNYEIKKKFSKNSTFNQSDYYNLENNENISNVDSHHINNNNNKNPINNKFYQHNDNLKNKNFKLSTFSNFSSNDGISPSPDSLVQFYNDSCKDSNKIENFITFKKPFKIDSDSNINSINKNNSKTNNNDKEMSLTLDPKISEINEKNFTLNRTQDKDKFINVIATFSDISSERNTTSPNKNFNINKKSLNSINISEKNLTNLDYVNKNKHKHFFPEEELNLDNEHMDMVKREKVEDVEIMSNANPYKNRSNKLPSEASFKKQQYTQNTGTSNNGNSLNSDNISSNSRLQIRDNNFTSNGPIQNNSNLSGFNPNNNQNKKTATNILNKGKYTNLNLVDDYETEFNNELINKSKNKYVFKNPNISPKNINNNPNDDVEDLSSNKTSEEMSNITHQSFKRQKRNTLPNEKDRKFKGALKSDYPGSLSSNLISETNKNPNYRNERFNSFNLNPNQNNVFNPTFTTNNQNISSNPNEYRKNRYHEKQTSYVPFKKNDFEKSSPNKHLNKTNSNVLKTIKSESDSDEEMRKFSMNKKINEFKKKLNQDDNSSNSSNNNNQIKNKNKNISISAMKEFEENLNKDHNQPETYNLRIIHRNLNENNNIYNNNSHKRKETSSFENEIKSNNFTSHKNLLENELLQHNEYYNNSDDIDNPKSNENQKLDNNSIKTVGNKLSFRNYKFDDKTTINNNSKYFTFSPGELTIPSFQESERLSLENKREYMSLTGIQKHMINNKSQVSNFNSEIQVSINKPINNYNKYSRNNLGENINFTNPILYNNTPNNQYYDETKIYYIVKGIDIVINLFETRIFKFIYSNLQSIYANFFKRLRLLSELSNSNQSNRYTINMKKTFSRSNSSNSNLNEQNNISKKSNEIQIQSKQIENLENYNNLQINSNKIFENLNYFNSQSNQNNNSSNFNSTLENNPNFKNFIRNLHSHDAINEEANGYNLEYAKGNKNNNLPNENYFSFENFSLQCNNNNNNSSKINNNLGVESINNLDNKINNTNNLYNNFKFNSFSNKNFLNNTFNKSNDNSDNISNKNYNSDCKSKETPKAAYNNNIFNSNNISPDNTISDTTSKKNDFRENINKQNYELDINNANNNHEFLYFAKILVKNIQTYYKRVKSDIFFFVIKKLINHCNFNVVLNLLNKRIMIKHVNLLQHYFSKFKKFNKLFNGILVLNSIYYRNLFHFFAIFGHHSRLYHIKKKYLHEFIDILEEIRIKKMKKMLIFKLIFNRYYSIMLPYFRRFLMTIMKLMSFNAKKTIFTLFKKMYLSQKLFQKNLCGFIRFLEVIFQNKKRQVFYSIKEISIRNNLLRNFVIKKYTTSLYYMKKVLQKFIDNALFYDKNLFTNIKLKKALKIHFYKQKLIIFKYLYKWKNKVDNLSKYVRDLDKPFKYNLSNELKLISVKKPKIKTRFYTISSSNFFDSKLSSPTKVQNNSIKRLVNLLTYLVNKSTFEYLYFYSFGKILSTNLKFDKSLYYINIFNSNYRLKSQASIDYNMYETQPNIFPINNSNLIQNNNFTNSNLFQNRISLESSLESHKYRSQLTFVCNNDNITESDKFQDLQYYLLQGNKQFNLNNSINTNNPSNQNLNLESPNKKNLNLPISINSLTTPKFLVSMAKQQQNVNINGHEAKNNHELKNDKNNNSTNKVNNNNSIIKKNHSTIFNNTISSPHNNFSTFPINTNTLRKNESFNNTISFKNSYQTSTVNKNVSSRNSNNSFKNDLNKNSYHSNNNNDNNNKWFLRNSESERNIFLDDRRIKNKKETNYINININIKDEKSDFNKIADLLDKKTKIYLSTRNKSREFLGNKSSNRSSSDNKRYSKNKLSVQNDFNSFKNLPFNGNITTRKKFATTDPWVTSPIGRVKNYKSNSISNYIELNKKNNYDGQTYMNFYTKQENNECRDKAYNFPMNNYNGYYKGNKKHYMTNKFNEDSYSYLNKLNNFRLNNKNSNIDRDKSPHNQVNPIKIDNLNYNKFIKYKKFTNNFQNKISHDVGSNIANISNNFHTYNPSINSISNTTINNPYTRNHFMIFIGILGEKIIKLKRYFFMKFVIFTENAEKVNKKYAIRLIMKVLKRRIICHKLNFLTRISTYIPSKKVNHKSESNNQVSNATKLTGDRIFDKKVFNHRKTCSMAENKYNTIDFINYKLDSKHINKLSKNPKLRK